MACRGGMQQVREFKALQREGRKRKRPSGWAAGRPPTAVIACGPNNWPLANWPLAGAVLHQLDAEKETLVANIAESLVPHQAPQSVQQIGADIGGAVGQFLGFQDLDVTDGTCRGERVVPLVADKTSITASTASSPSFFAI
jgi:hypothetical protein